VFTTSKCVFLSKLYEFEDFTVKLKIPEKLGAKNSKKHVFLTDLPAFIDLQLNV